MQYNKKNQPFTIVGRFQLEDSEGVKEYCRVRFHNTKKEQVVLNKLVKTGDFEDQSLVAETSVEGGFIKTDVVVPVNIDGGDINVPIFNTSTMSQPSKEEIKVSLEALDAVVDMTEITEVPPVEIPTGEFKPLGILEELTVVEFKIIATNPKGEDIQVDDLKAFCEENGLDLEAVEAVLEGKQKTHRKWRFTKA